MLRQWRLRQWEFQAMEVETIITSRCGLKAHAPPRPYHAAASPLQTPAAAHHILPYHTHIYAHMHVHTRKTTGCNPESPVSPNTHTHIHACSHSKDQQQHTTFSRINTHVDTHTRTRGHAARAHSVIMIPLIPMS